MTAGRDEGEGWLKGERQILTGRERRQIFIINYGAINVSPELSIAATFNSPPMVLGLPADDELAMASHSVDRDRHFADRV